MIPEQKFITLALLKEKAKRIAMRKDIIAALATKYRREIGSICKRGKVYETISIATKSPNNNTFKRIVKDILLELGILPVCVHKNLLFKHIADDNSEELRRHLRYLHSSMKSRQRQRNRFS